MACKYGRLKSRVRGRTCKKKPRGRSSYRSRSRSRSRAPRGGCKYGMLKSPTKGRRCRKAPRGASRSRTSYRSRRKPTGMARRGSRCTSFRRVRVRTNRGYTMQRRCRKFVAR